VLGIVFQQPKQFILLSLSSLLIHHIYGFRVLDYVIFIFRLG
jgi:hypothetical protein